MKFVKLFYLLAVISLSFSALARWSDEDCNALSRRLDEAYQAGGEYDSTFLGLLSLYDRNC